MISMENTATIESQLKISLHAVSIQFSKNAIQVPTTFPPLYIRVSHGFQSTDSDKVTVSEAHHGSGNYIASWKADSLPITSEMCQEAGGASVVPAELKFQLKIFSEKKQSHKSLASTTLHTASLNLAGAPSIERKRLMLSVGRNATAVIQSVELDVTFDYEHREEQQLENFTSSSCHHASLSLPEPQQLKDETPSTQQDLSEDKHLLEISSQDSVSATAVLQHFDSSAHHDTTTETPKTATVQSTEVVGMQQHNPPCKPDGLQAKSKGKKLKGIFKLKGRKKTKDKDVEVTKGTVVPMGSQDVETSPKVNAIEHQKSMPNTSAMDEFHKVTIGSRHTEDNTPEVSEPASKQAEANESISPKQEWSVKPRLSRQPHIQGKKPRTSLQDKTHYLPLSKVTVDATPDQMHTEEIIKTNQSVSASDLTTPTTTIPSSSRRVKYHMHPHAKSVASYVVPPATKLPLPPRLSKTSSESNTGTGKSHHMYQEASRLEKQHDPIVSTKSKVGEAPDSHLMNAPTSATCMNDLCQATIPGNLKSVGETTTTKIQEPIPGSEVKCSGSQPVESSISLKHKVQDKSVLKAKKQRRNDGAKSKQFSASTVPVAGAAGSLKKSTDGARTNDPPVSVPSQSSSAKGIKGQMRPRSQSVASLVPKHNHPQPLANALSQSRLGVNDMQHKTSGSTQQSQRRLSVSDLIKPSGRSAQSKQRKISDLHGILKVRICGASVADGPQLPTDNLTDLIGAMQNPIEDKKQSPTEGLYCVLTINGSNARAETATQPIVNRKPVVWNKSEQAIFHTSQSRQIFVMCRKIKLQNKVSSSTTKAASTPVNVKSQIKDDMCIGAAVLSVADIRVTEQVSTLNIMSQEQYEVKYLPLQPKGSILLEASFSALQPRFKISCKGTVTLMKLSGVKCNPNHDLCCTIKIDSEFQDSTSIVPANECSTDGWKDDPIEFNSSCNQDCDLQIWAYSSEETEYWCGGCVFPLAMVMSEHDAKMHQERDSDDSYVVTQACEKTVTIPVEPAGTMVLSLMLYPSPRSVSSLAKGNQGGKQIRFIDTPESEVKEVSFSTSHSHSETKQKSLRRNLTSMYSSDDLGLKVRTTYKEEPFLMQQENADLKKEVEYLKEELRQAKASLAESEFFKEKALLELRAALEEVSHRK